MEDLYDDIGAFEKRLKYTGPIGGPLDNNGIIFLKIFTSTKLLLLIFCILKLKEICHDIPLS